MAREIQVTFDSRDPAALAAFWAEALGYQVQAPPSGFDTWDAALAAMGVPADRRNDASAVTDPDGSGPRIFFQRVPEGGPERNPVHLDVRAAQGRSGDERMDTLEAECQRLVALGASRGVRFEPEPPLELGHIVMTDPEGNVFCLD